MTTRTTTFGQGSHPARAVVLKTGVRRRSSTERAIWRSSGLGTEDFSTVAPPYLSAFCSPTGTRLPMAYLQEEQSRSLKTSAAIAIPKISQKTLTEIVGTTRWSSASQVRVAFYERNEYLLRSVDSSGGGQRNGCCSHDPPSRSQLRT